jgi:putative phosphoribosyl transferase
MEILRALGISNQDFDAITAKEQKELRRREYLYRGDRKPLCVSGLTVILVDDGVATGASLLAGIRALRQLRPAKIVVAVPVAAPSARERLAPEVDDFVCVAEPDEFRAVGQFYDDFSQVEDGEVMSLLSRSRAADSRKVA